MLQRLEAVREKYKDKPCPAATYVALGRIVPEEMFNPTFWVVLKDNNGLGENEGRWDRVREVKEDKVVMKGDSRVDKLQAMSIAAKCDGEMYCKGRKVCLVDVMVKKDVDIGKVKGVWRKWRAIEGQELCAFVETVGEENWYAMEIWRALPKLYHKSVLHPKGLFYAVLNNNLWCNKCGCVGHEESHCGMRNVAIAEILCRNESSELVREDKRVTKEIAWKNYHEKRKAAKKAWSDYDYTKNRAKIWKRENDSNGEKNLNMQESNIKVVSEGDSVNERGGKEKTVKTVRQVNEVKEDSLNEAESKTENTSVVMNVEETRITKEKEDQWIHRMVRRRKSKCSWEELRGTWTVQEMSALLEAVNNASMNIDKNEMVKIQTNMLEILGRDTSNDKNRAAITKKYLDIKSKKGWVRARDGKKYYAVQ